MSIYNDSIYYVYAYLREDYTPYYIGKGKNQRRYKSHKKIPVPKNSNYNIIIQDNLTELQAFILERYYIRWFGRKNNNTGVLRNMTDGGEGSSGLIVSEETKNKHREDAKNNINNLNKGKQWVYCYNIRGERKRMDAKDFYKQSHTKEWVYYRTPEGERRRLLGGTSRLVFGCSASKSSKNAVRS